MRRVDWQERFAALVKERATMPFEWGRNDCCLFAADAVLAMTGDVDPAQTLRGYASASAAQRLVEEAGGLRELCSQFLGEPVSPLMAGVGDVVILINEGRELVAICNGVSAIAPGPNSLVALDMSAALAAWKI